MEICWKNVRPIETKTSTDNKWIYNYEESWETFGWNDLQKFVYAKQPSEARQFISSQGNLNNWRILKNALSKEFKRKVNSVHIPNLLKNRKRTKDKSYLQYVNANFV